MDVVKTLESIVNKYNIDRRYIHVAITESALADNVDSLNKTVKRIQTIVDFNRIGKFIIKKDFPFDFYTKVDGKRDITFNIEFLNSFNITDISEFIEINA